ncbi:amino acid ABC transporter permease [Silvimonas iriomotensis]|nr:amino acid ABC transporter permease [Silvimonas iriomotensis]
MSAELLAPKYLVWMAHGLLMTAWIALIAIACSTLAGFALALARDAQAGVWRGLARIYTLVFRNTPLLIQLFFWYFAAPNLLPETAMLWLNTPHQLQLAGFTLSWPSFEFLAGAAGLSLYATAFVAEDIRSGIRGVPRGQYEAAAASGLTRWQVQRYVILPQALRHVVSPLFGQYMNIVKNSSLTMGIGLAELSYTSRQVEAASFLTFQAFGVATLGYIGLIAVLDVLARQLQQRVALPARN